MWILPRTFWGIPESAEMGWTYLAQISLLLGSAHNATVSSDFSFKRPYIPIFLFPGWSTRGETCACGPNQHATLVLQRRGQHQLVVRVFSI